MSGLTEVSMSSWGLEKQLTIDFGNDPSSVIPEYNSDLSTKTEDVVRTRNLLNKNMDEITTFQLKLESQYSSGNITAEQMQKNPTNLNHYIIHKGVLDTNMEVCGKVTQLINYVSLRLHQFETQINKFNKELDDVTTPNSTKDIYRREVDVVTKTFDEWKKTKANLEATKSSIEEIVKTSTEALGKYFKSTGIRSYKLVQKIASSYTNADGVILKYQTHFATNLQKLVRTYLFNQNLLRRRTLWNKAIAETRKALENAPVYGPQQKPETAGIKGEETTSTMETANETTVDNSKETTTPVPTQTIDETKVESGKETKTTSNSNETKSKPKLEQARREAEAARLEAEKARREAEEARKEIEKIKSRERKLAAELKQAQNKNKQASIAAGKKKSKHKTNKN